jgi:signal transduction histidine kinase
LGELRSRFVSLVSHEFRTPLGVIMSAAENLDAYMDRLRPEQRQAQLQHVIQATRQMAKVMENVLLLGRAEAAHLEFKPVKVDLVSLCKAVAQQVESSTGAVCPIELKCGSSAEGRADETLLRHILTNLLTNAVKYSAAGRTVEFTLERRDGEALFRIRDHGIGIPAEDQARLFTSFHRGRNAAHVPGTGLGLVIVKHCVELHGGKIVCESKEGSGTTFTVTLPLAP